MVARIESSAKISFSNTSALNLHSEVAPDRCHLFRLGQVVLKMPRRPRPADRPAPKSGAVSARRYKPTNYSITSPKRQHITFAETELESESQSEQIDHGEKGMSGEDAEYASSDSGPGHEEEDVDVDAPRVAQWEPDELEFNDSVEGEDEENAPNSAGPSHVQLV